LSDSAIPGSHEPFGQRVESVVGLVLAIRQVVDLQAQPAGGLKRGCERGRNVGDQGQAIGGGRLGVVDDPEQPGNLVDRLALIQKLARFFEGRNILVGISTAAGPVGRRAEVIAKVVAVSPESRWRNSEHVGNLRGDESGHNAPEYTRGRIVSKPGAHASGPERLRIKRLALDSGGPALTARRGRSRGREDLRPLGDRV